MSDLIRLIHPKSNYVPAGVRNFARAFSYIWVLFAALTPYGLAIFAWGPALFGPVMFFKIWSEYMSYMALPAGVLFVYLIGKKKTVQPTWLQTVTHKYPWRIFAGGVVLYIVGLLIVMLSGKNNSFNIGFGLAPLFFIPFDAIILFVGLMVIRQVEAKLDFLDKNNGKISEQQ